MCLQPTLVRRSGNETKLGMVHYLDEGAQSFPELLLKLLLDLHHVYLTAGHHHTSEGVLISAHTLQGYGHKDVLKLGVYSDHIPHIH